jgi:O-antigen ligase
MDRARVDNWCEKGVLMLVLMALAVGVLGLGGVRNEELAIMAILIVAATGLWLTRIWMARAAEIHWPPMCWGALVFVVYALAVYPYAPVEYAARSELYRVLIYALMFFVVVDNARGRHAENIIAYPLIAIATVVSIYGAYQFLTRSDMVWHFVRPTQYAGRGSGTFICPNHLAGLLAITLPIAVAYLFHGRAAATAKTLIGYAALIIAGGLATTVSRGGWAAAGLSLTVLFVVLFIKRRTNRLPVILALVIFVGGGIGLVIKGSLASTRMELTTASGKVDDLRFLIWKSAAGLWSDHPWVGAGPGQFEHQFRTHRPRRLQMHPVRVHNDYLNTLADWGVLGFLIVLGSWMAFWFTVRAAWRWGNRDGDDLGAKSSDRTAFLLGTSTGIGALLIHSLVDFNFHIPANASVAIVLAALVGALTRGARAFTVFRLEIGGKLIVTTLCALCSVWLVQESYTKYQEGRLITASRHLGLPLDEQKAHLLAAQAIDPMNPWTTFRIGENIRNTWWESDHNYHGPMKEAIGWFDRAQELDPLYSFALVRAGMCWDFLRKYEQAEPYFLRASELDPRGANTASLTGWHWVQVDEFAKAREKFHRALFLSEGNDDLAMEYLQILDEIAPEPAKPATPAPAPETN